MSDDNRIAELEHLLFNEQDWRKRQTAAHELCRIDSRQAWDLIGKALLDENIHVAETAADLLADYGCDALPHLLTGLSKANEHVLPMILNSIGRIGDRTAAPFVEKLISHTDDYVRGVALAVLSDLAEPQDVIPHLLAGLQSTSRSLQERCAELIGPLRVPEAVPYLREIVLNKDQFTTLMAGRSAAIALGKIGGSAIDILLEASHHEMYEIRQNAAVALGESDDSRAFTRIVELLNDESHMVASNAVHGLEKLDHPATFELLLPLLDRPGVNQSALPLLGETGDLRAIPILIERLRQRQHNADRGLYQFSHKYWGTKPLERDMTILPEVMQAAKESPDKRIRIAAIWALANFGYDYYRLREVWMAEHESTHGLEVPEIYLEIRDLVISLLREEDSDIQISALHALVNSADQETLPELVHYLLHPDIIIAEKALEVIGRVEHLEQLNLESIVPNLLEVLKRDDSELLRRSAIQHLGLIANKQAIEALLSLVNDEHEPLRDVAANALGGAGSQSLPLLLSLVTDDASPDVRWKAAWAIHTYVMRTMTKDKAIADVMARALRDIGSAPDETYPIRQWATYTLARLGDETAIPALLEAIEKSPEWQIKMHAINALGGIGDPRLAAERLYRLLEHSESIVRTVAANRLGFIGTKSEDEELRNEIVEQLIPKLGDIGEGHLMRPTVGYAAATSLYYIGTRRALDALDERQAGDTHLK